VVTEPWRNIRDIEEVAVKEVYVADIYRGDGRLCDRAWCAGVFLEEQVAK
jgi:hypothetical protein